MRLGKRPMMLKIVILFIVHWLSKEGVEPHDSAIVFRKLERHLDSLETSGILQNQTLYAVRHIRAIITGLISTLDPPIES